MEIHIFGYAKIRARWIGPLHLTECSQPIHGMFVAAFQFVWHIIIIYVTRHRKPSTTSSQLVCNSFISWWLRILKTKTPFLHFKNHTFVHQKPPFCTPKRGFLLCKKAGLHNKNEQPEKPLPVATMPNTQTPPHNNTTHSAHAYA